MPPEEQETEPTDPVNQPVVEKTWKEFQSTGLFWWINRGLQLFGWVLVYVENAAGEVTRVYPARTTWRGFPADVEAAGFARVSTYLALNAPALVRETLPAVSSDPS